MSETAALKEKALKELILDNDIRNAMRKEIIEHRKKQFEKLKKQGLLTEKRKKQLLEDENRLLQEVEWLGTAGHLALDIAGAAFDIAGTFFPPAAPVLMTIGSTADIANAMWYFSEGSYFFGTLSLISAIPDLGDLVAKPLKLLLFIPTKGLRWAVVGPTVKILRKNAPWIRGKLAKLAQQHFPKYYDNIMKTFDEFISIKNVDEFTEFMARRGGAGKKVPASVAKAAEQEVIRRARRPAGAFVARRVMGPAAKEATERLVGSVSDDVARVVANPRVAADVATNTLRTAGILSQSQKVRLVKAAYATAANMVRAGGILFKAYKLFIKAKIVARGTRIAYNTFMVYDEDTGKTWNLDPKGTTPQGRIRVGRYRNCPNLPLKIKCKGSEVLSIQTCLKKLGYDLGTYGPNKDGIDGKYGNVTKAAVKKFQADKGLADNGAVDKNTLDALVQACVGDKETKTSEKEVPEDESSRIAQAYETGKFTRSMALRYIRGSTDAAETDEQKSMAYEIVKYLIDRRRLTPKAAFNKTRKALSGTMDWEKAKRKAIDMLDISPRRWAELEDLAEENEDLNLTEQNDLFAVLMEYKQSAHNKMLTKLIKNINK